MAARMVFDLVDPAVLVQYVRDYDNEVLRNQMALEAWLPNRPNANLEFKVNQARFKDVDVAEFRAFDTQPRMTGRQGFTSIAGELPPLARQIPLLEEEMLRLRALMGGNAEGNRQMIDAIFSDAERMIRSVQMRLEMARGQLLSTGTVSINENGVNITADFNMKATHKPTVATSWANPAADIIADLLSYTQLFVDDTGTEPGVLVMSRQTLGYFYNNTGMKNALGFAGTTPTRLNNEMIDAVLAQNGLPGVVLYDTQATVEGVRTRIIPHDKVLLLPAAGEEVGETQYGVTAEAIKLAEKGMIVAADMPGIVACVYENDSPVQTFTAGHAIALPLLFNPDAVISVDVRPDLAFAS